MVFLHRGRRDRLCHCWSCNASHLRYQAFRCPPQATQVSVRCIVTVCCLIRQLRNCNVALRPRSLMNSARLDATGAGQHPRFDILRALVSTNPLSSHSGHDDNCACIACEIVLAGGATVANADHPSQRKRENAQGWSSRHKILSVLHLRHSAPRTSPPGRHSHGPSSLPCSFARRGLSCLCAFVPACILCIKGRQWFGWAIICQDLRIHWSPFVRCPALSALDLVRTACD